MLVYIKHVGKNLAYVMPLDAVDPGFGVPGLGGGVDPDYGIDTGHHPDHGLPGGRPPHVGNRPPGSGGGGIPDNSLPSTPPPTLLPGYTLVLLRGPDGKWKYATLAPGSAPPKPIPEPIPPGGAPDQGLPPQSGGAPSQPIQPTPAPKA